MDIIEVSYRKKAPRRRKIARGKAKKPRKVKSPAITKLKKEADSAMSLYIRQKYADKDGNVTCYTCPFTAHWKKMQNGHLVSRYYLSTRYDERNCRPQCITCNIWRNGMTPHFAEKLEKELGTGIVGELYALARELRKGFDYQAVKEKYQALLKELNEQESHANG